MKKYLAGASLLLTLAQGAWAQTGSVNPYSQYGLGHLSEQATGFNRGMNGLGIAFREGNQVNVTNPASYSSIDSLSFIFDGGVSGQVTLYKEGDRRLTTKNAKFDYIVAGFKAFKHVGVSFGFMPYSNIAYSYMTQSPVKDADNTIAYSTYTGSGGLNQVYVGVGWEVLKGLSIGVNGAYFYGQYNKSLFNTYNDPKINSLTKTFSADVRSYKFDIGVQYVARLSKTDELTIGATYGIGHKIGGDPKLEMTSTNAQTGVVDSTSLQGGTHDLFLELPTSYGAGLMYKHGTMLKVGVDYQRQQWAAVQSPVYAPKNGSAMGSYHMAKGDYKDRQRFVVGADFCPKNNSGRLYNRIHYRVGMSYATPYYYINGQDGPAEISASLGLGIPIVNSFNNRSLLNISAQWVRQSAKNYISDNTFRINIGLTFNERWFAKWKVD